MFTINKKEKRLNCILLIYNKIEAYHTNDQILIPMPKYDTKIL